MSSELHNEILVEFQKLRDFVQSHCREEENNTRIQMETLANIDRNQRDIQKSIVQIETKVAREEQETQNIYTMIGSVKERVSKLEVLAGIKPNTIVGMFTSKNLLIVFGSIVLIAAFYYGVITQDNIGNLVDQVKQDP